MYFQIFYSVVTVVVNGDFIGARTCRYDGVTFQRGNAYGKFLCPRSPRNLEESGWLCYPKCPAGYTGYGPVCWMGIYSHGRGAGYALQYQCPNHYYPDLHGLFCWEQCPPAFEKRETSFYYCYQKDCPPSMPYKVRDVCCSTSVEEECLGSDLYPLPTPRLCNLGDFDDGHDDDDRRLMAGTGLPSDSDDDNHLLV